VGQACITATIFYVQAGMYDGFAEMLREATAELVIGHGAEKGTTMGPLTTARDLAKAERQVQDAVRQGAKIVLGSGRAMERGWGGRRVTSLSRRS
jgi:succinate-semialdehyde dehydrogenase / glutarate-semialdehyde dehydrogenase